MTFFKKKLKKGFQKGWKKPQEWQKQQHYKHQIGSCYKCGQKGHIKASCPQKKQNKDNNPVAMTISEALVLEPSSNSWWIDSAATRHIVQNKDMLGHINKNKMSRMFKSGLLPKGWQFETESTGILDPDPGLSATVDLTLNSHSYRHSSLTAAVLPHYRSSHSLSHIRRRCAPSPPIVPNLEDGDDEDGDLEDGDDEDEQHLCSPPPIKTDLKMDRSGSDSYVYVYIF
ncbi:hypothetical protein CsSME_00032912 [Camellia sinensis var. sinensis]